jgi:hypothetical protein
MDAAVSGGGAQTSILGGPADALGVVSWRVVPRERNRTANEMVRTQRDLEWQVGGGSCGASKWSAVTAHAGQTPDLGDNSRMTRSRNW